MNKFRTWCSTLFGYDWVGIPLVYTQVKVFPNKQFLTFPSFANISASKRQHSADMSTLSLWSNTFSLWSPAGLNQTNSIISPGGHMRTGIKQIGRKNLLIFLICWTVPDRPIMKSGTIRSVTNCRFNFLLLRLSLSLSLGCNVGCLHVLLSLHHRSTISWPHSGLPGTWPWPLCASLHTAAVLLLFWMA